MTNLIVSVNCKWSSWESWRTCPVTCGGGIQIRTRTKLFSHAFSVCLGKSHQEKQCSTNPCPGTLKVKFIVYIYKLCSEQLIQNFMPTYCFHGPNLEMVSYWKFKNSSSYSTFVVISIHCTTVEFRPAFLNIF